MTTAQVLVLAPWWSQPRAQPAHTLQNEDPCKWLQMTAPYQSPQIIVKQYRDGGPHHAPAKLHIFEQKKHCLETTISDDLLHSSWNAIKCGGSVLSTPESFLAKKTIEQSLSTDSIHNNSSNIISSSFIITFSCPILIWSLFGQHMREPFLCNTWMWIVFKNCKRNTYSWKVKLVLRLEKGKYTFLSNFLSIPDLSQANHIKSIPLDFVVSLYLYTYTTHMYNIHTIIHTIKYVRYLWTMRVFSIWC